VSSHFGHSPVVHAAVCLGGRPADDVVDDAGGAIFEAKGCLAHGWQAVALSRNSRVLLWARLYHIHSCAVDCGDGCRGTKTGGVEELHIVARRDAYADG